MRKYISDIITNKEISKWQPGNRILICSQTGSGKSEFIKNTLYEHCKNNNKMILLMSNRNLLKNQNMEDIAGKEKYIRAHNYQEYESRILEGFDMFELFESFDYIVYDEAHYFFSDSQFNKNTDLLINPIKDTPKDKIFIFITATPDALLDYQKDYNYKYELPYDYSYIKDIYFYTRLTNKSSIVESIISNLPTDEKILYFGSSAQDNYDISIKFEDSSFICSAGNKLHDKSNQNAIDQIVKHARFESRILFATKLLDNGVNIKDKKLKHIIIDMVDPISFIQSLGRKRCMSPDDQITLYVKDYHRGLIHYIVDGFNAKIIEIQSSNLPPDNVAKYQHYLTQRRILSKMTFGKYDNYKKYICDLLMFDMAKVKNANDEFEKNSLISLLENNIGKKMFKNEQENFKELFFDKVFTPKRTDYIARGIKAANGIMEEDDLKFIIYSRQETKGKNRNKTYWVIESTKEIQ